MVFNLITELNWSSTHRDIWLIDLFLAALYFHFLKMFVYLPHCWGSEWGAGTPLDLQWLSAVAHTVLHFPLMFWLPFT